MLENVLHWARNKKMGFHEGFFYPKRETVIILENRDGIKLGCIKSSLPDLVETARRNCV